MKRKTYLNCKHIRHETKCNFYCSYVNKFICCHVCDKSKVCNNVDSPKLCEMYKK